MIRLCLACGKELPESAPANRFYCNDSCQQNAYRRRKLEKAGPDICPVCGKRRVLGLAFFGGFGNVAKTAEFIEENYCTCQAKDGQK